MAVQDARPTQYGIRKLGRKKWEEQQAKNKVSHRAATVYGPRKSGAARAPSSADPVVLDPSNDQGEGSPGETNPFLTGKGDRITISRLEEVLIEKPGLLDVAIEAELAHEDRPRKGALELLLKIEGARESGPRDGVVKLIEGALKKIQDA